MSKAAAAALERVNLMNVSMGSQGQYIACLRSVAAASGEHPDTSLDSAQTQSWLQVPLLPPQFRTQWQLMEQALQASEQEWDSLNAAPVARFEPIQIHVQVDQEMDVPPSDDEGYDDDWVPRPSPSPRLHLYGLASFSSLVEPVNALHIASKSC